MAHSDATGALVQSELEGAIARSCETAELPAPRRAILGASSVKKETGGIADAVTKLARIASKVMDIVSPSNITVLFDILR